MDRALAIKGSDMRRVELMGPEGQTRFWKAQGPFYGVSGQKCRL
jgi:hypothetical protein